MNHLLARLKLPLIISALLVLPLILLEGVNRQWFAEGFPLPLFALLWLLPLAFTLILMPLVHKVRAREMRQGNPLLLLLQVVTLILIAWMWGSIILDQMPCFLGVPNCD